MVGYRGLWIWILYVQYISGELSPISTFVTPVQIEIRKTNGLRHFTVRYQASSRPLVKWSLNSIDMDESDDALTFLNDFSVTSNIGTAMIIMPISHFHPDPPSDVSVHLYLEEFNVILKFKNGDIIDSENFSYNLNPVYYDIGSRDMLEYVKGEQFNFSISLRSLDLHKYDVFRSESNIDSLDYGMVPPERIQRWARLSEDRGSLTRITEGLYYARSFEVINATSITKACSLNTSFDDNVSGTGAIDLILDPKEGNPIVKKLYMNRVFYIKEVGQSAPYRENTLVVLRTPSTSLGYADENMYRNSRSFTYTAIGYPKPEITLKRGCADVGESVTATSLQSSRYTSTVKFTFLSPPQYDKWETYIVVAKSGSSEISDFLSVDRSN